MIRTLSFNQVDGDELLQPALGPVRYELLEEDAPEWSDDGDAEWPRRQGTRESWRGADKRGVRAAAPKDAARAT